MAGSSFTRGKASRSRGGRSWGFRTTRCIPQSAVRRWRGRAPRRPMHWRPARVLHPRRPRPWAASTSSTSNTTRRWAMSYVDTTGTLRIGLGSYFDNVWSYAFGIDLLQPGEVGLRAAVTYSIPNAGSHPDSLYQVS